MISIGKSTNKFRNAMIAYLIMVVTCELLRVILRSVSFPAGAPPEVSGFTWSFFSQIICMYGLPLLFICVMERPKQRTLIRELSYRATVKWWVYLVAVVMGLLAVFVTIGVNVITNFIILITGGRIPSYSSNLTNNVGYFFLVLLGSAVFPAVCEEGLHRGILLRGLRPHFKDSTLIVLTALFFALMHTYIMQTGYTFVFGLIIGTLSVKLKSIWPAMIIHFVNNAVATYSDYAMQFHWVGGDVINAGYNILNNLMSTNLGLAIFLWCVMCAVMVGLLWVCVRFGRRKHREETASKLDGFTGERLLGDCTLVRVAHMDNVWLGTAIFCSGIFTFFTYLSILL